MIISDFPFKGTRTYLHGTEVFNWVVSILPQLGFKNKSDLVLKLSFHRRFSTQLILDLEKSAQQETHSEPTAVTAEIFLSGSVKRLHLYESGITPTRRIPYDEDVITSACTVFEKTIKISKITEYSPIETLVAMTKCLHLSVVDSSIKWAFVRLELSRLLKDEDKEGVEVKILQSLQNRFTKSQISSHGEEIGSIYFSAW